MLASLVTTWILVATPAGGGAAQAAEDPVVRVLLASLEGEPLEPAELLRDLVALGASAVPTLFGAFEQGAIPGTPREVHRLDSVRRGIVLEALAALPRSAVHGHLTRIAEGPPAGVDPAAALLVLERTGTGSESGLAIRLATPAEQADVPRALRESLGRTLFAMVERDPATVRPLRDLLSGAHPALRAPMVRAIARAGSGEALEALAMLLGVSAELDPLLLAEIRRLGDGLPHPVADAVLRAVRPRLEDNDPSVLHGAVLAAAGLEDYESIPVLLDLLDTSDANLRRGAIRALGRISGRDLGRDPTAWEAWYGEELRWWTEEADDLFLALRSAGPTEAVRAVQAISRRRLHRHDIARGLAAGLQRGETDLVVLVCASLGRLESWGIVPDLVRLLEHEDERIGHAAWLALSRITKKDFPPDSEEWEELRP